MQEKICRFGLRSGREDERNQQEQRPLAMERTCGRWLLSLFLRLNVLPIAPEAVKETELNIIDRDWPWTSITCHCPATAPASLTMFSEQWGRMLSRQPRCEGVPNVFASRLRRGIGQAIAGTSCPSEDCLESGRQRGWTRVTVDVAISRPAKGQTLRQAARPGHRPAEPHQHDWESAPRVLRGRDWKQKAVRQIRRRYSGDAVIHSLYPSLAGRTKLWCSQLQKQWY